MLELLKNEQYFFDQSSLEELVKYLKPWKSIACLCAPLLGKTLVERGHPVTILDIDKRFEVVPGFQYFDIYQPWWLDNQFDLIFCDPPFFNTSLSQLFYAIRILNHHSWEQPLMISYLVRRSKAILGTFRPFQLRAINYYPTYQTVKACQKNEIQLFGNIDFVSNEIDEII